MKVAYFFCLLLVLSSCRSSRFSDASVQPTTFRGDSLLFKEFDKVSISYSALSDIIRLSADLKPGKELSILLNYPSQISAANAWYTVYPGEDICITAGEDGYPVFTINGNKQRNREFRFEAAMNRLHYQLLPKVPHRDRSYSLDTILFFEKQLKAALPLYISQSNALLDSLAAAYQISDGFKEFARIVLENRQRSISDGLYISYQQELKEAGLYKQKINELLPLVNTIRSRKHIDLGGSVFIKSIMFELMSIKGNRIKTEQQLIEALDTVKTSLTGISRDFYLTDVMYHALYRNVPVSRKTLRSYYRLCKDAAYESIVRNYIEQKKKYATQAKRKKDNRLIAFSNAKVYTLDEVLEQQKGKLVLIDIWASWCVPCLEQQPYMEKLKQRLKGENITFLYLSMDKELNRWRQRNNDLELDSHFSYVFEGREKQSFIEKYSIETIPRYLLLDENGNMINANTPMPESGELEKLIRLHLDKK